MKQLLLPFLLIGGTATAQTTSSAPYCEAHYSGGFMDVPHAIERVQLGTLDNESGATATPLPHYMYYSNLPATDLARGQEYTLTMRYDGGQTTHGIAAWIDFNSDDDFDDAGEKLGDTPWPSDFGNTVSYTFTVPQSAVAGITRLRARVYEYDDYTFSGMEHPVQPCLFNGMEADWGEAEDYNVNITTALGLEEQVEQVRVMVEGNRLVIRDLQVKQAAVIDASGKIVQQFASGETEIGNLQPGIYLVRIEAQDGTVSGVKLHF